jgi:glycosyltransferase involved in cell wall biosynthesis
MAPEAGVPNLTESSAPYGFNLLHMTPDTMRVFLSRHGPQILTGRYNVAAWVWELHAAYSDWHSLSSAFHEIWVPTDFVFRALGATVVAPMFKIPHVVDELPEPAGMGRSFFGWPENQYVFLYIFDMASSIRRKNPLALIRAFRCAFPANRDVLLVLKYQHAEANPAAANLLQRSVAGAGNIKLIAETLPDEEVFSLLRLADCFVSPHRGEGFGLNIASAMYYGKPVIVTAYSGNMDYTNEENSFLIDFDLAPIGKDVGYYKANYAWAAVVEDHLTHLLRVVHTNREEAARRGANARRTVRDLFSRTRIQHLLKERIANWTGAGKPDSDPALPLATD